MKIVRMIPVSKLIPPVYKTWAINVFEYMKNIQCDTLHIVFDVYPSEDLSLPSKGRYDPDKIGERRYVSSLSQRLPPNQKAWNSYLSNDQNKRELTQLLIDFVLNGNYSFDKTVFITREEKCFLKRPNEMAIEVPELQTYVTEADPRLALHAVYSSNLYPNQSVCVVADDTDVYILLLSVASQMKGTLLFRQGTSSCIEYHNVSALAEHLGYECCKNLPGFHALTGCDFTYPFYGRSKNRAFNMMMNISKSKKRNTTYHLLDSLGSIEPNFEDLTKFVLNTIYNRPLHETSPTSSRVAMLSTGNGKRKNIRYRSTKAIPPDTNSLHMKIKR